MLVERSGDLITREEIQKKLWPNDTIVEFDHSINTAVTKLRQALGDSAENPRYVETVARRGYRLMVNAQPVQSASEPEPAAPSPKEPHDSFQRNAPKVPMGVLSGKKVSHYRVLEILGGGGMGVVYRAEGIKLGRRVALKFLPEESAKDPAALGRFEREARSASALEHPNICPIYEFGEHEGQPFLAMQLLEGETLRELILAASPGNPPLALNKLLDLAIQITAGLDAAHQKGIIHRDIKPANIFVTSDGQAKILDFGLAKLARLVSGAEDDSDPDSPSIRGATGTLRDGGPVATPDEFLSLTGAAMGTAGYMSPEQVRGEKLDARTDLFSFGLVLYEMATGKRAFAGNTRPGIHEAILRHLPSPAREINPELPPKLEQIIGRALEKVREARYQSASEMRADLQSLQQELEPRRRARWWVMAAAGVVLLFLASAAFWFARRRSDSRPEMKETQLTANSNDNPVTGGAVSPDGKYLSYSDMKGIHLKLIATGETQTLMQSSSEWYFAWFPDSTRFLASKTYQRGIWAFAVMGGAPSKFREDGTVSIVSPDGATVSFTINTGRVGDREIWLIGADGTNPRKFLEVGEDSGLQEPLWSPDGQRILYEILHQTPDSLEVKVESRDLSGGSPAVVYSEAAATTERMKLQDFVWLPRGRIIFSLAAPDPDLVNSLFGRCNLWELLIDPRSGQPSGTLRRLTNWNWPGGTSINDVYATADGKRLSVRRMAPSVSVYLADFDAQGKRISAPNPFTASEAQNSAPAWTGDSQAIFFESNRDGRLQIFRQEIAGATAQPVATGPGEASTPLLSPDGSFLLYLTPAHAMVGDSSKLFQLMRAPRTGGPPQRVLSARLFDSPRCTRAPANLCAIAEPSQDRKQMIFTAFDPLQGRGRELARIGVDRSTRADSRTS